MPKIHICVLEDSLDIQEIVKMIFEEEGYRVDSFSSVADFDSGIMLLTPDLFLLDIMLPDGNGIDECRELKQGNDFKNIPLLLMSAHAQSKLVVQECPADGFIPKPFDIYDFMAQVNNQLSKAS